MTRELPTFDIEQVSSSGSKAGDATTDRVEAGLATGSETDKCESKKLVSEAYQVKQPKEGNPKPTECKELQLEPKTGESQSKVDTASIASEKKLTTHESSVLSLQSASEGKTPLIREKVMHDGYNWRKYGQKLVKGNEFIRSYYRCTQPNCKAKKQLERTSEGQTVDTNYFGQHDHHKPLGSHSVTTGAVPLYQHKHTDAFAAASKEKLSGSCGQTPHRTVPTPIGKRLQVSVTSSADDLKAGTSQSSRTKGETHKDNIPAPKRRKKEGGYVEQCQLDSPTNESRSVVHTQTLFDVVNDGYRWRKYGQKSVKGSPYPRSYYRCSSSGCLAKKHVERSSHDGKFLITTYEGKHDHDMPPGRTLTHNKMLDLEVDNAKNKELNSKAQDPNTTPQISALLTITETQDGHKPEQTNTGEDGFEKNLDQGSVLDVKPMEQMILSKSDKPNGKIGNHVKPGIKSEDKATACQENTGKALGSQERNSGTEAVQI